MLYTLIRHGERFLVMIFILSMFFSNEHVCPQMKSSIVCFYVLSSML